MRIRFFHAFASNNSGAYVLLGRFHDVAVAEATAAELNEALAAHDAWEAILPPARDPSPFMAFAERHGLPMQGGWVPWEAGMRCEVLGQQILLESYAADMPSAFVAWVAKHGGHVETELIHAHGATVLKARVWMDGHWQPEKKDASAAAHLRFEERMRTDAELADTIAPRHEKDPKRALHFVRDPMGSRLVLLAPRDVTRASRVIRAAATAEGLRTDFSVTEWIDERGDPAAVMAGAASAPDGDD